MESAVLGFLVTYAAGRVLDQSLDALLEPNEQVRLKQVVQRAVARTVQPYSEEIGPDLTVHLDSVLNYLLASGGLAPVEEGATAGRPVDAAVFQAALEEQGLDVATIGVPASDLLSRFVNEFLD